MKLALAFALPLLLALVSSPVSAQGSWTNLGSGKTGSFGVPVLVATPPNLGAVLTFSVLAARPNSVAVFFIGLQPAILSVLGGTLVPAPDIVVVLRTDARGNATLAINLPNDRRLMVIRPTAQCLIADPLATFGVAFTNALAGTFCQWFSTSENFTSSLFLDQDRSSGTWGGGSLTFSPFGGDGRHGVFDPKLGKDITNPTKPVKVYEWDLSKPGGFKIPLTHTKSGKDELVQDGRFFFQRMEVPVGVEVHFIGSVAARITVQGTTTIGGLLSANGESLPTAGRPGSELALRLKAARFGEKGGRGGAMGGAGGNGGDPGDGLGNKPAFDGRPGKIVQLIPRHFYSTNYAGTRGAGSRQFPIAGTNASIIFSFFNVISQQANRGGGGGGFTAPGGVGSAKWTGPNSANQKYLAKGTTAGGTGFPFPAAFPNYTIAFSRQDHYIAGGSGGGGGGSAPGGSIKSIVNDRWRAGRAGGGGGGAIGLRLGRGLDVLLTGRIEARGGSGAFDQSNFSIRGMMTPGGGGSGGALFLQVSLATNNTGKISVAGGAGGVTVGNGGDQVYSGMRAVGGGGSNGILHFETALDPNGYNVGTTIPSKPPVVRFDPKDRDKLVSVSSLWYPTNLLFRPEFLRYEIEALVDGKPVTFSDDPRARPLAGGAGPLLRFTVQGATLTIGTNGKFVPKSGTTVTPWLPYVGPFSNPSLFSSGKNGYRFELTIDHSLGKAVVVKKIAVFWCL
jgi:hypothetical protein